MMVSTPAIVVPSLGQASDFSQSHRWESGIGRLWDVGTRHILSANMLALMSKRPGLDTLKKITHATGGSLSNGKLGRIRLASHSTDIDTLGELATVFGVEPWQLLVPNLDPEALPVIASTRLLTDIRSLVAQESKSDAGQAIPDTGTQQRHERREPDKVQDPVQKLRALNLKNGSDSARRKAVGVSKSGRSGGVGNSRGAGKKKGAR